MFVSIDVCERCLSRAIVDYTLNGAAAWQNRSVVRRTTWPRRYHHHHHHHHHQLQQQQRVTSHAEWCGDVNSMKSVNDGDDDDACCTIYCCWHQLALRGLSVCPAYSHAGADCPVVCNIIFTLGRSLPAFCRWLDDRACLIVPKWNTNCHLGEAPARACRVSGSPTIPLPFLSVCHAAKGHNILPRRRELNDGAQQCTIDDLHRVVYFRYAVSFCALRLVKKIFSVIIISNSRTFSMLVADGSESVNEQAALSAKSHRAWRSKRWTKRFERFYARKQNASRVFAIVWASVCLSVCPSVRHTRELYQNGAS